MRKRILLLMIVFISALGWARIPTQAEVTEVAQDIVSRDSFQGIMAGKTVKSVTWVALEEGYGVWAVSLSPNGHLILGHSTKYRAMISWSEEAFVTPDRASPQYALLLRAAQRAAAAEAGDGEEHPSWKLDNASLLALTPAPSDFSDSAIVHQPVKTADWNQSDVMAWYAPGDAPCGCVATSNAQLMHALQWPVYPEGQFKATLPYTNANNVSSSGTYAFSPYSKFDYAKMAYECPTEAPYDASQQVARLVLFNDILAQMRFAKGESYAVADWAAVTPWTTEVDHRKIGSNGAYTETDVAAIKAVMEAGIPIMVGTTNHAFIASGYALYNAEPYVRLNFGFGGFRNGWYHIDFATEYMIVYPIRSAQCDPLPAVSSASPTLSWHVPKCYDDTVTGFTVSATEIPVATATDESWRDSFFSLTGTVTGNRAAVKTASGGLQISMAGVPNNAPKVLYTWAPIYVPSAEGAWSFYWRTSAARGPILFQVLPPGGVWETVLEVTASSAWKFETIDLSKYAGQPIKLRLFAHPTVNSNAIYSGDIFSMTDMYVTGLSQVIDKPTKTFTVNDAAAREYTIPSGQLTAGARYAFTVTPTFTDAADTTYPSMPCYTQIATDTVSAESFTEMTFSSPSPEAKTVSGMTILQNTFRYCAYSGQSVIRLETDASIETLELHSSHPDAYPLSAFSVKTYGSGLFDIVVDGAALPTSPRVNDRLNLSVSALTAKGTRTTQELSLVFTTDETFAVSETVTPPDETTHPTSLSVDISSGEQTLDSLTWTDVETGTTYATSDITWDYVTTVYITVSGGTLTLGNSHTLTGSLVIGPDARVKLTHADALSNLTVSGSGTLECAGIFPSKRGGLTDATWWQGTVELTGNITLANVNESLEVLGHSKSTLRVSGTVTGYLAKDKTCEIPLELNGSITIRDGYTDGYYIFSKLTGTGTFIHNRNLVYPIAFADASEFKGTLTVSQAKAQLVIGNKDDAINGAIVVSSDKTATLGSTASWSAPNGVTIEGTLGGSGTIASDLTFAAGSKLDVAQGPLTVTGAVTADETVSVLNVSDETSTVLTSSNTLPANPETVFLATGYTAYTVTEDGANSIVFRKAIRVPEGTSPDELALALAAVKAAAPEASVTEITNPEVASIITGCGVELNGSVATLTHTFEVNELAVTTDGIDFSVGLSEGEEQAFADGVKFFLIDARDDSVVTELTVENGRCTFSLPDDPTFIFKIRVTK